MTNAEAIKLLELAKAEIEWEYSLEYQVAFDMAIKALEQESILDKIRAEITNIEIYGQTDSRTSFIRTGEQVKNMAIGIIDKYKEG